MRQTITLKSGNIYEVIGEPYATDKGAMMVRAQRLDTDKRIVRVFSVDRIDAPASEPTTPTPASPPVREDAPAPTPAGQSDPNAPAQFALAHWCAAAGILPTHPTTERGAISLLADHRIPGFSDLWNLVDYVVSTRSGPVVWLVPRSKPAPTPLFPTGPRTAVTYPVGESSDAS